MALELLSAACGVRCPVSAMVPPALDLCSHLPASGGGQCLNALVSARFHYRYLSAGVFSPLWPLWACRSHCFLEASQLLLVPGAHCRLCCGFSAHCALFPP